MGKFMWENSLRVCLAGAVAFSPVLLSVCSGPQPTTAAFLSRDSAGVRVWEHPDLESAPSEHWTVDPAPLLTLGQAEGEEPFLFSRIRASVTLHERGIAVADGLSNEIRIFDGDGVHLRTFGGTGSGPGEFTHLRRAFPYRGDSIVATNFMGGTLQVFSSKGDLGRSFDCDPASSSMSALHPEGALSSGRFVVRAMRQLQTETPTEGYHREYSVFQLCNPDGSPGSLLEELPDLEFGTVIESGRPMSYPLEMGRRAVSAVVGDGVFVGVTDRLELRGYDGDGAMTTILRVGIPPTPMSDRIADRWIEDRLETVDDDEEERRVRQRSGELPWPDSLPVFADLKGDAEGNLWVRRFVPTYAGGPDEWWVFGPDGSFRARVTLPPGLRLGAIGSDVLVGVMTDEWGVERVVQFRLEKGRELAVEG
jgi:hypothetical protein